MSIDKARRQLAEAISLTLPPYSDQDTISRDDRIHGLERAIDAMIVERFRATRALPRAPAAVLIQDADGPWRLAVPSVPPGERRPDGLLQETWPTADAAIEWLAVNHPGIDTVVLTVPHAKRGAAQEPTCT